MADRLPEPGIPHDGALRPHERGTGARRRAWLLGLIAGVLGGFLLVSWGVGRPWLGLIAIVVGGLVPPRPIALSGALVGWGGVWIALLIMADARCDPATCRGPDIAPWLVASAVLVIVGLVVLGYGALRTATRR